MRNTFPNCSTWNNLIYIIRSFVIIFSYILLLGSCSVEKIIIEVPETVKFKKIEHRPKVVLVLGGGGSKGVAHLGVLKILEENHIPIDLIIGCSAGAIIGSFYADEPDEKHIREIFLKIEKDDLIENIVFNYSTFPVILGGPVTGEKLRRFLANNLNARSFEELKIPLIVVTTELIPGKKFLINSGPLIPALHASSAIPVVFKPVKLYGRILADGAIAAPIPISVAKEFKPDIIIAVNISQPPANIKLENNLDVLSRAFEISYYQLLSEEIIGADVEISPKLDHVGMFDDSKNDEVYLEGIKAAKEALPKIQKLLKKYSYNKKK